MAEKKRSRWPYKATVDCKPQLKQGSAQEQLGGAVWPIVQDLKLQVPSSEPSDCAPTGRPKGEQEKSPRSSGSVVGTDSWNHHSKVKAAVPVEQPVHWTMTRNPENPLKVTFHASRPALATPEAGQSTHG